MKTEAGKAKSLANLKPGSKPGPRRSRSDGFRLKPSKKNINGDDRIMPSTGAVRDDNAVVAFFDAKKELKLHTPPELTPTAAFVWHVSKWDQAEFPDAKRIEFFSNTLGETSAGHIGHASDALLAVTAFARANIFVTADPGLLRRTRKAVLKCQSNLAVLDYSEFAAEMGFKS